MPVGMEYSPTDLNSPILHLLGHPVKGRSEYFMWHTGHLADVRVSGDAVIEVDGFVSAIVPAYTVKEA